MLKRILIISGILLVGIASFSLLNKHSEVDTAVANKDEPEPLSTKELFRFKNENIAQIPFFFNPFCL